MKNKTTILFGILLTVPLIVFIFYSSGFQETEAINNQDYAPALIEEINQAYKSIHIAMFSITYYDNYEDSSANKILKALADAKARGVDVKIVIDEYPDDHEKGVEFLQEHNISVKYDGKSQTTHAKLIIIDSKTVILGSSNWRYYSLDKNNEANVKILSKVIAKEYEDYFQQIWENGNNIQN